MIDKVCCINDITFAEANDDQSNYSNGSRKSEKSTKKEKAVPNTFRVSLSERRQNKNLQAKDSFYHRASIAAPSSEIILLNPDKKGVVKNISNLPIVYGGNCGKNFNKNVYCINLESGEIKNLTENLESDKMPIPRADHAAEIQGDNLYVYGGYGPDNVYLDDVWCFNLGSNSWTQVKFGD